MNSVEGLQFLTNLSDEVKEAIQVVIGELIEKKIQKVIENWEKKNRNCNYSTLGSVEG